MAFKHEIRFFIFIALAFASGMFIYATLTDDDKQKQEFEQNYRIYSLPIPQKVSFAGVSIPLKEYDVAERYDREILTNVYWQSQTLMLLKRSQRFLPTIDRILKENNIPADFKYLAMAESGLQNVSSPAGAAGFWQFLDKTAKRYKLDVNEDLDERYHLEKATQAACLYFKEAYAIFNDWALVAASYNMGIEGVRRQMQNQQMKSYFDLYLNVETSRYLFRIIAIKDICENPTKFGFHIPTNHYYKDVPSVKVKVDLSISQLSEWAIQYKGTPGSCLAVRIVSEVFTLSTLGAGVSLPVRNSWKLCKSRLTILRMKSISPLSIWHSRTSGSARICSSNSRKLASAWLLRLTIANTVIAKPSLDGSRSA